MQKCFLFAIWFACTSACADIVQPSKTGSRATYFYRPLGQSFMATSSEAQIRVVSFRTGDIINSQNSDPTISLQLRNGIGYTGLVLGSQTVTSIPKSTPPLTWIDFVFDAPIALTPGQTYTLEFSATNVERVALSYAFTHNNPYPSGTLIESDGTSVAHEDLAFRVLSIPEPSSSVLLVAVAAWFLPRRPRRK